MFISDKKTYRNRVYLSFLARFLIGEGRGKGKGGYMVQTPLSEKLKNFQNFKNKNFKKSENRKKKLSGSLYSDKLLYSLKFGVKFGLYCVKSIGVVVCTGVVIKVSYVAKIG